MTLSARAGRTGSADSHVRVGNLRLGAWGGAPERWTFVQNRRNVRQIAESGPLSLLTRVERYFAGRFVGVTKSEAWGYVVWSIVGAAVAAPEIWAAVSGSDFIWPTISGTVGHLEDKWSVVALAPVALIAGAAFTVGRFQEGVALQTDGEVLARTPEGRLAKSGNVEEIPGPYDQLVKFSLEGRRTWRVFPYFAVATAATVAFSLLAAAGNNKWLTGYVLYSLIAIFGLIIPNALAYWRKTDVKFSTLFFTLRTLERRLHLVAIAIAAGLMILLFHLAIYPWPDLARDSASYAGLTPSKAEKQATHALTRKYPDTPLKASAQSKEIFDGSRAWFVYFRGPRGYSNCVVVVSSQGPDHVPVECKTNG
jgi:hypothetical protein